MQLIAEPTPTKYDLRFTVRGIPVRVHPWFWLATILLSIDKQTTLLSFAIWVPVVFVSILVHELGHAWAFIRYGDEPRISMHGMGGLAIGGRTWGEHSDRQHIVIAAAGPVAGFLFGGLVALLVARLGYQVDLLGFNLIAGDPIPNKALWLLVQQLLAINIVWGLVNLVPVYPLDGSSIFYHAFFARDPVRGRERSVRTSVIVALIMVLVGLLLMQSTFVGLLFAFLAFSSWQMMLQLDAPVLVMPAFARRLRARWRGEVAARQRKAIDRKLEVGLEALDAHEAEAAPDVSPDVARTANELLARLNEEISREVKKRR